MIVERKDNLKRKKEKINNRYKKYLVLYLLD